MASVLFLLKVPPPIHGSTLMNQHVYKSELLRNKFDTIHFPLSISNDVSNVGKWSVTKIGKVLSSYVSFYKTLRNSRPDLAYFALSPVGLAFIKDYIFYLLIHFFRIKIVFHLHGKGIKNYGETRWLFNLLYRRLFWNNHVICLAPELVSDVEKYIQNKPFIIPNGISKFDCEVKQRHKSSKFNIVFLSNFIESKGVFEVIEACKELKERSINFTLSLIGKPGDISMASLEEKLKITNLTGSIDHIGPLYGQEKYAKLSSSHLLVFPTYYPNECLPLVIIEAMQCGLPVISTDEGGIPSLIDNGTNGYIIEKHDTAALASKIEYLILHPEIAENMGKKAKEKFESNFTLKRFEENIAQTLEYILESTANKI